MASDLDHYEAYYADKLWQLLPAIYRTEDTDRFDKNGPLRELVNRIGAQVAVVRRSVDRLWEDQSVETCDDWAIPYIAQLLATNLVASLDARGQRLDVAKTIYYRRRKGTVAVLEEIAHDITGWDARVVEFFRRMGRTRHGLDPEIGLPSETDDPTGNRALQLAEGLVGPLTKTHIGGWADLRNVYGASRTATAFDEFYHTADFRRGRGRAGWHNVPRLGVFLWRLRSFPLDVPVDPDAALVMPVAHADPQCAAHFTFDPTGREVPLFAASSRTKGDYGDNWVSPDEWQLPTPISSSLLLKEKDNLYADASGLNSVGVFQDSTASLVPSTDLKIDPERGRFKVLTSFDQDNLRAWYHHGFSSTIGAGFYDRRVLGERAEPRPGAEATVSGGFGHLAATLAAVAPTGTVSIEDSLTYNVVSDVGSIANGIEQVTIRAGNRLRPLIRLPDATEWAFDGAQGSVLNLEGLFVSGGALVLRGEFESVNISCSTLDPGSTGASANPPATLAKTIDGRELKPCRLWIEGRVRSLRIERSIIASIATRAGGEVEQTVIADSIVQMFVAGEHALDLVSGEVRLARTTLLGRARVHRFDASECILDDVVKVEDAQHGCVRFSAFATGSQLPRRYECAEIAPQSSLFTSRVFGRPGYAQLLSSVDAAIVAGGARRTIAEGAQDGSEMGAFAREKNPIKERSLHIKYEEFMPVGLIPVVIYAT
ncbi:MAG: hypothetical protein QOE33_3462 [Acidobacteriota bacterium]|nr:hypothetical protein [Acidobacteriota bacterium]